MNANERKYNSEAFTFIRVYLRLNIHSASDAWSTMMPGPMVEDTMIFFT